MSYLRFEAGDIVLIELPFSDLSGSKLRPVLVVSKKEWNDKLSDLIVIKITGTKYEKALQIELENKDLEKGKLKKRSYIELSFILTVEKSLVRKKIARLKAEKRKEVLEKIRGLFK